MKVIMLKGTQRVYTSNVFLCLGDWNRIEDVNTLVDVGSDPAILAEIERCPSGIGKKKVELVILTHGHSDHAGNLELIRAAYRPVVCAFTPFIEGVDRVLKDGERIRVADRVCEVIHLPGHSEDSIGLYCQEEGFLFAGDAPVIVQSGNGHYDSRFTDRLHSLCRKSLRAVYFGHGEPLLENAKRALTRSFHLMMAGNSEARRCTDTTIRKEGYNQ